MNVVDNIVAIVLVALLLWCLFLLLPRRSR